ncbi:hypothetical protein [Azospirillum sp. TSO22-1]|uniref:hypothetical protein n=1 Tax=Azospirillum sp. TSO22-1 TaxID=716789 RepID=UPI000D643702|nr:hypothetical protein [Azospirillum sp. TSO22-1]
MNIDRFRHLAEACGAEIERWPASERAAARALLAASEDAQRALGQARVLDAWLDLAAPAVNDADAERVLAAIERRLAPPTTAWIPGAAGSTRRSVWSAAGFLALMGVCGFVLGQFELVTLWRSTAPQESGFTALVASSSPSLAWDQ